MSNKALQLTFLKTHAQVFKHLNSAVKPQSDTTKFKRAVARAAPTMLNRQLKQAVAGGGEDKQLSAGTSSYRGKASKSLPERVCSQTSQRKRSGFRGRTEILWFFTEISDIVLLI